MPCKLNTTGRDGPGLAGAVGRSGGRQRGVVRGAEAGGPGPAPTRSREEPTRTGLALEEPPRFLRTFRARRAVGPIQVPGLDGGSGGDAVGSPGAALPQPGRAKYRPLPPPPPVHRGGIGVLGLYPRSSAQPHPASLPAAFGSPRSCSLTSRTGTASQGICWSASPQVSTHPPPLRARLSLQAPRVPSSPPSHSRSSHTLQATSSTTASTSSSTSSPARPGSTWCTTPW